MTSAGLFDDGAQSFSEATRLTALAPQRGGQLASVHAWNVPIAPGEDVDGDDAPRRLPGYREFDGGPIERIAAVHSKPGRDAGRVQRWFVETDAHWSAQHSHDDPDTIADLMLANFSEHAGRSITPTSLAAHFWRHGVVATPAVTPRGSLCLWDRECRIGVRGDSVVASRRELVRRSGVDLARAIAGSMLQSSRHIVMPWPKIVARNGSSLAIQQAEAAACRESE